MRETMLKWNYFAKDTVGKQLIKVIRFTNDRLTI